MNAPLFGQPPVGLGSFQFGAVVTRAAFCVDLFVAIWFCFLDKQGGSHGWAIWSFKRWLHCFPRGLNFLNIFLASWVLDILFL